MQPAYHVTAPHNWLNDPNGPVWWRGRWHLFFQHNPAAPEWGRPHWGHVSSPDLVHWQRHPNALSPSPGGPDRDGCWSGCIRILDGVPTAFYTGVVGETDNDRLESVCRARSHGDLVRWRKDPTPLIAGPPPEVTTGVHRDPFLVTEGHTTWLLLGSSLAGTDAPAAADGPAGAVLAYRSQDLEDWTYHGVAFTRPAGGPDLDTGPIWECPQLVRDDGDDALVVSVQDPARTRPPCEVVAVTGRFAAGAFNATSVQRLDLGDVFYAPAAVAGTDRNLLWGWIQDPTPAPGPGGVASLVGCLSLPRSVTVTGDRVAVAPATELVALRQATEEVTLNDQRDHHALVLPGPQAEVELVLDGDGRADLELDPSAGGQGPVVIIDREHRRVTGAPNGPDGPGRRTAPLVGDGPVDVRFFADGTVVEVFVAATHAITLRRPVTAGKALGLRLDGAMLPSRVRVHHLLSRGVVGSVSDRPTP